VTGVQTCALPIFGTLDMKGVDKKISKSTEKLIKQFVKDTTKKG